MMFIHFSPSTRASYAPLSRRAHKMFLCFILASWFAQLSLAQGQVDVRREPLSSRSDINVGIEAVVSEGKTGYRYNLLATEGLSDVLTASSSPSSYYDSCRQSGRSKLTCMWLMQLWSEILLDDKRQGRLEEAANERIRGWNFRRHLYWLLNNDLAATGRTHESVAELSVHLEFVNQLGDTPYWREKPPPDVLVTMAEYYVHLWSALPSEPHDYAEFWPKFLAGEHAKQVLYVLTSPNIRETLDGPFAKTAWNFYREAFLFHLRVAPHSPHQDGASQVLATIRGGAGKLDVGIGYVGVPQETGLQPLPALAETDVLDADRLVQFQVDRGLASESELSSKGQELKMRQRLIRITHLRRQELRASRQQDWLSVAETRRRLATEYEASGDIAEHEHLLEQIRKYYRSVGDQEKFATWTVQLAASKNARREWANALALYGEIDALLAGGGIWSPHFASGEMTMNSAAWLNILTSENKVRANLNLPAISTKQAERLIAEWSLLEDALVATAPGNATLGLSHLRSFLKREDLPPYLRRAAGARLFRVLRDMGNFEEAEHVVESLLPEVRKWSGKPGETMLLGEMLSLERDAGSLGRFLETLRTYREANHELRGENWRGDKARLLAEVAFALQDYRGAEAHVEWDLAFNKLKVLDSGVLGSLRYYRKDNLGNLEDLMLLTRIYLERGQRDAACDLLQRLDESTAQHRGSTFVERLVSHMGDRIEEVRRTLLQLAKLDTAAGRQESARRRLQQLMKGLDAIDDPALWTEATILDARIKLAAGLQVDDTVRRFEELVPHLLENRDLGALLAIEIDLFLSDYYLASKQFDLADSRLQRADILARDGGAQDQEIVICRKRGEIAIQLGELRKAAQLFRESIRLLRNVSIDISSDLQKVGYRAERNEAISLLAVTLWKLYRESSESQYLDQMWEVVEEGKSRALTETILRAPSRALTHFNAKTLRAAIPKDAVLLEYYAPEKGSDEVYRFKVDRNTITVDTLVARSDVVVSSVHKLLQELSSPHSFDPNGFRSRAREIAKILLPEDWVSFDAIRYRRIIIVPTGVLYLFPFSLLPDEQGRWLDEMEKIELANLPNAASLLRPARPYSGQAAAFLNPALDDDLHAASSGVTDKLAKAFSSWSKGRVYPEEALTPAQFLDRARKLDSAFVYSHARFLPQDPVGSYIRFAPGEGDWDTLSALDLQNAKIGSGLWVLAACSTGAGRIRSGDEVLGLPRALLAAGAGMVVISLWDVDSYRSLELMTSLYESLSAGSSVAGALKKATRNARERGWPPFDWAPFILIGAFDFKR